MIFTDDDAERNGVARGACLPLVYPRRCRATKKSDKRATNTRERETIHRSGVVGDSDDD